MIWKIRVLRVMKVPILALVVVFFLLNVQAEAQKTIDYLGYRISIPLPKAKIYSVVTIKKGRKTLAVHREGLALDYGSSAKLISLFGSRKKQLVISQYTGGNHCCNPYWIYELTPKFRLLFRSKDFETIGNSDSQKLFQNVDHDADMEIVDNTRAFHYFDDLAFVSSPVPKLIFDYNHRTKKFELANRKFQSFLIGDIQKWISNANDVKDSDHNQFAVWMFTIFLDYVYAGKKDEGLKFYYRNEKLKQLRLAHRWKAVNKVLKSEPAYRELYRK